jgi:hypothetical protein
MTPPAQFAHCDVLLPNAPCGLNPSSPIILFKAAAIASRSFFSLAWNLRRGRTLAEGTVRFALITKEQKVLRIRTKASFCTNFFTNRKKSSCLQAESKEGKLLRLRKNAPDLAEYVTEEKLPGRGPL